MTQPVLKMAQSIYDSDSQQDAFKQILEDHLPLFKAEEGTVYEITGEQAYRCSGDFYALLGELGISPDLHWLTLRYNGFSSPEEFDGEVKAIVEPNKGLFQGLLQKYKSRERNV